MTIVQPAVPSSTAESVRTHLIETIGQTRVEAARRHLRRKAVVVVATFIVSYALLLLGRQSAVALVVGVVGLMLVGYASISTVMHDANHNAMFEDPRSSRRVGYWLDVFGASSMIWCFKHNDVHHDFANVTDTDTDIQQGPFLRLSPHQKWRPWYRFQHVYAPFLYGFVTLQTFLADFVNLTRRKVKNQSMVRRPGLGDLAIFGAGKVVFVLWAAAIPTLLYGWPALVVGLVASWFVGLALALTVQVAHAVDIVEFEESHDALPDEDFVTFQARVTADVVTTGARGWMLRWMAGGLDRQLAHHLAPSLPHTLYPHCLLYTSPSPRDS